MESPKTSAHAHNSDTPMDFLDIEKIIAKLAVSNAAMVKRITLIETLVVSVLQLKIEDNRG